LYDKYYEEIEENLDIINEIVEERKNKLNMQKSESMNEDTVNNEDLELKEIKMIVNTDNNK
jgi:hypothetical protein